MKTNNFEVHGTSAQYDGFCAGEFGASVNMFKGEAVFDYPLITGLPDKNGIGIKVSARYSSNTDSSCKADNMTEPTGVLGLGWQFGFPFIMRADTEQIFPPEQETFYINSAENGISRLYHTKRRWLIAKLNSSIKKEFNTGKVSQNVVELFFEQGIGMTINSEIMSCPEGFCIIDSVEEMEYIIVDNGTNDLDVYFNGLMFEPSNFDFSRIVYFPRFEKWIVAQKDGLRKYFGGLSNISALQYMVHYDGVIIPSNCTAGQQAAVMRWNLSKELSIWDDEVNYSYLQDLQNVNDRSSEKYTKACYLSEITDDYGYRVTFCYDDKVFTQNKKEYIDPGFPDSDTPITQGNCYQNCYETKFLSKISTYNPSGDWVESIEFGYNLLSLAGSSKTMGGNVKRLLTSVTRKLASGGQIPPEIFTYNMGEKSNTGAIETITTSAGTVIKYDYTQKQLTQCSTRSYTLPKENYTKNKIWNSNDYSAVLLYNEELSLFRIYNWVGRFQVWTPPEQPFNYIFDNTNAIVLNDSILVYTSSEADNTTKVVCYRKDPDISGNWTVEISETFPSAYCSVTASGDWIIVNEQDIGRLTLFTYELLHRKTVRSVQQLDSTHIYSIAPNENSYALLNYDVEGIAGSKSSSISIFTLDGYGEWKMTASEALPDIVAVFDSVKRIAALSINFSGTLCSVAAVTNTDNRIFYYDMFVWKVTDKVTDLYKNSFSANCGKNVWNSPPIMWQPTICGQLIISGGVVLAYDGNKIHENTKLCSLDFDLNKGIILQAAGNNCVLQSRIIDDSNDKEVLGQALIYNPEYGDDFPNINPVQVYYEKPIELKKDGYVPSICGTTAVFNDIVYDLNEKEPFLNPFVTLEDCVSSSVINRSNFIAYLNHSEITKYIRIINRIPASSQPLQGKIPSISNGFNVFSAEEESSITIYINTGDSFHEPVSNYQIAQIIADDGFGKSGKKYVYDDKSAICDVSGKFVKYYTIDVYSQNNNENGFTRYCYCNSIAEVLPSENAYKPYAADGRLLNTIIFDSNKNILSQSNFEYNITRFIADSPNSERNTPIYGAVNESTVSDTIENGVKSSVKIVYDASSGEASHIVTSSRNAFGDMITVKKQSYTGAAEYAELAYQNRISERSKIITEWSKNNSTPQIVEAKAVDFDKFSNKKRKIIISKETLIWKGKGDPKSADNADWEIKTRTKLFDNNGNVIENEVPKGILQSQFYSADGCLSLGNITNAGVTSGEVMICTFEKYENIPSQWQEFVSNEKAFAGTWSLKIKENSSVPPIVHNIPKGEYIAAFWSIGMADISIKGENVEIQSENFMETDKGIYHIVKFAAHRNTNLMVTFSNKSNESVYADVFSISPYQSPPTIHIYKNYLLDTSISAYGEFTRNIYDRRNHLIGNIDEKSIQYLTLPFYNRLSKFGGENSKYNAEIILKFTDFSHYEMDSRLNYISDLPASDEKTGTFAVYVDVKGKGNASMSLGNVSVSFGDGKWTMEEGGNIKEVSGETADGEWLLLSGKRVLFFFNGENVFGIDASIYSTPTKLSLSGSNIKFSKLLYGNKVSFGIRYLDTSGKVHQGQMFEENNIIVTQNFYDYENRMIAQTKPVTLSGIPFGYIEDFALLDSITGIMSGRIAEAYPKDEGFPYVCQAFENTPFGRKIESGLPGKEYCINPAVPEEQRKTVKLSYKPINIPELLLKDNEYYYTVTTSQEGTQSVSVLNSQKQQVAVAVLGKSKSIISVYDAEYNGTMLIEKNYLPEYFDGNKKAIRVKKYDFNGRLLSESDPNCNGETRYCYNSMGEMRFMQTPELAKEKKIIYQKYNKIHCVIEEGYCLDTWEYVLSMADNVDYPMKNIVKLRTYEYGNDIKNIACFTNLILVKTFNEDGSEGPGESYDYDTRGRKKSKSICIPEIDRNFKESCEFDCDGNIISVTNSLGNKIVYEYDSVGRMTKESMSNGSDISTYSYLANDMIESIKTSGGTTKYEYTSTGWIEKISSPLMNESITYKGTKISEFTVNLNVDSKTVPTSVRYVVAYDEFSRLKSALCYNKDVLLEDISINDICYDLNGNIKNANIGGRLKNYLYQSNTDRLLKVDDNSGFDYNLDGAVTSAKSAGIDKIVYSNGKPVSFQTKKGNFDIVYDTSGNRLMKTASDGKKTVYIYNSKNKVSEEITLPDGNVKQYLYGQFGLRAIIDKGNINDVYTDHLGSPRVIANKGSVIAAAQYTPLGKSMPIIGAMDYGFNGYGQDSETGLYFSNYRIYDSEIGRFYSLDPKPGSESPYIFCGNDPINRIDLDGDSWWGVLLGVVTGIIGVAATVLTAGLCLPAAMASESALIAETVVGAVAGAVGSVTGMLVNASCDKQTITGKMVIGALVSGGIGGVGSLAGPIGQIAMRSMMGIASVGKITAVGIATGCTIGAAAGIGGSLVYNAVSGMPVSGVSIAIAALAGMGTGLLATRASYGFMSPGQTKTLPVMIKPAEVNSIRSGVELEDMYANMYVNIDGNIMTLGEKLHNKFFAFIDNKTFLETGISMILEKQDPFLVSNGANGYIAGNENAAVIACHGFGRHCFVISRYNDEFVWRPIKGSDFVNYFSNTLGNQVTDVSYVKLLICFSGCRPGGSSTAQKFATALNKTVYATRGIAKPENLEQQYLSFHP